MQEFTAEQMEKTGQLGTKLQITFAGMLHCWQTIPTSWYQLARVAECGNEVPGFCKEVEMRAGYCDSMQGKLRVGLSVGLVASRQQGQGEGKVTRKSSASEKGAGFHLARTQA
jgi:hypothetical protein